MSGLISMLPALVGAGASIYGTVSANKNAKQAQQQQVKDQLKLNEHSKEDQLDMWNKTNFPQQVKMIKSAGLNPGLIYGQGGQQGTTAGAPAGGQASQAQTHQLGKMDIAQLGMMSAQKNLLEAQTKKAEAEAEKTAGVDTKATEAQALNTVADTAIKQIRAYVEGETQADTIFKIGKEAQKAMHDANIAYQDQYVKEETAEATKLKIEAEAVGAMIEAQAKKQGLKLTEAQIKKINEEISQGWERLRLESRGQDISVKNMEELTETMLWQSGINATGNLVNSIIDIKKMSRGSTMKEATSETFYDKKGNMSERHRTTTRQMK